MLHHISLPVTDIEASTRLYASALEALGVRLVCKGDGFVGFGFVDNQDKLLLTQRVDATAASAGFHLAFSAPTRLAVDAFYTAALRNGATDNGPPGLRAHYGPNYYAAFVIDPDGHRLEAVCK